MSDRRTAGKMVATKSKSKVLSCSTPDHTLDSPSRDSDSMCESEMASPVPFLCTQDGAEGITDVVWNYYNTSSKSSLHKNSTPISKKTRVPHRLKLPEKELQPTFSKRKVMRPSQKKIQLPRELLELKDYADKLMEKNTQTSENVDKPQSGSEDDIFNDVGDCSPKSIFRPKRCLRKNVLKTKFSKPEFENGLDSDDAINECLLRASQAVEDTILNEVPQKKRCFENHLNPHIKPNINDDSMDAIIKNISSPYINKFKCESPGFKNDSFDNFVENLNDSAIERLTQIPIKNGSICRISDRYKAQDSKSKLDELEMNNASSSPSSRLSFARHSSMPESPSISDNSKPTSSMSIGRFKSMPFKDSSEKNTGDSSTICTKSEIQMKRQQAREKLLAKRQLPFTQTQQTSHSLPSKVQNSVITTQEASKKLKFQPKVSTPINHKEVEDCLKPEEITSNQNTSTTSNDLQSLIERKRQEALIKLRRRQQQK